MNRPNLFLIGAPKCGTTAIAHYLSCHADVLLSSPKEAKYFHTDFTPAHRLALSLEEYWKMFGGRSAMEAYPVVAEGTVWYLYSQTAVPNILEYNPDARFLVMVRNPVDLAHSLHAQLLYGGDEDVDDFEQAWGLQEARSRGSFIPPLCRDARSLRYGDIARQGEQIARLYRLVDRDAVRVGVFDDLIREPGAEYRSILRFLGLEDDGRSSFPIVNRNREIRFPAIARVLGWGSRIKRRLGMRRTLHVWRITRPLVSRERPRRPMTDALRTELNRYFAEDVALLSELLGRDLAHWSAS